MSGNKFSAILTGDSAYVVGMSNYSLVRVNAFCLFCRGGTLTVNVVTKILELKNGITKIRGVESLPLPTGVVLVYPALDFNFVSWLSADHLRVLRTEQSSNNIPRIREFAQRKDHLHHVSPLSMVPDRKPRKRVKRRSSWKDTIRGFTSTGEESILGSRPKIVRSNTHTEDGSLADAESGDESFEGYREEDKPIEARVKYKYDYSETNGSILRTHSALERQQEEMALALKKADMKANQAFNGKGTKTGPIGTRLTMSSRAGYFQDRIVSPSMVGVHAVRDS